MIIRHEVGRWQEKFLLLMIILSLNKSLLQLYLHWFNYLINDHPRIIGSSCGLLCLDGYLRYYSIRYMVVLWNPSIRKLIVVAMSNPIEHRRLDTLLKKRVLPTAETVEKQ